MQKKEEKKDNKKPKAIIYCRVSSEKQKTEGHGLDGQELRCRQYAGQKAYEVDKVFKDSFSGGGDFMKRPAMQEMLAYIDGRPHLNYIVIFDDLKRFARDTEFHLKLRTALRLRNVIPECLNYKFDDTPEGMFVETIFAAQGQLEREQNKRQVVQKQKARLEKGYWPFGGKKGYKIVQDPEHGKLAVPDKKYSRLLKEALEGFAKANFVRRVDACKYLVENGFWKTKRSPEKYIDNFVAMAKNPFYAGFIEYPSWEVAKRPGKHKGIISQETFDLLQKRLRNDLAGKQVRKDITEDFPLRGLLVCTECNKHLTSAWSKGRNKRHPYYFCQNKECSQRGKSLRKDDVESGFDAILSKQTLKSQVDKLLVRVFDNTWNDEISNIDKIRSDVLKQKKELKERLGQLSTLAIKAKSDSVRSVYEEQMSDLAEKVHDIEENQPEDIDHSIPYRTALDKSTRLLKSPYTVWKHLDIFEQHKLFFFIFEEKLAYSKKAGYRTDNLPSAARLFEDFVDSNSSDVEVPGIEPGCK